MLNNWINSHKYGLSALGDHSLAPVLKGCRGKYRGEAGDRKKGGCVLFGFFLKGEKCKFCWGAGKIIQDVIVFSPSCDLLHF